MSSLMGFFAPENAKAFCENVLISGAPARQIELQATCNECAAASLPLDHRFLLGQTLAAPTRPICFAARQSWVKVVPLYPPGQHQRMEARSSELAELARKRTRNDIGLYGASNQRLDASLGVCSGRDLSIQPLNFAGKPPHFCAGRRHSALQKQELLGVLVGKPSPLQEE